MLLGFDEVAARINKGEVLHIAGSESILKKLPKGNWIGGSTEYFMAQEGGKVSDEVLFVTALPYIEYKIDVYDVASIPNVAVDAYGNGFTILIVPYDSEVHKIYAEQAAEYKDMFIKIVAGWISGINLDKADQTPIAVNGATGEAFADKAVALHLALPEDDSVNISLVNIFQPDPASPLITFEEEGFSVKDCLVDGKKVNLAKYIADNGIDTKLPLIGDYSGSGVNISFKTIEDDTVNLYAPVFDGIEYRLASSIPDYEKAFNEHIRKLKEEKVVFSCNCILNFIYGGLEGKNIDTFTGPITFGEIAYLLVNQTLVYVTIH